MPGCSRPAGDLGFEEEPLAAARVVGVVVEYLLESDLAVQLTIQRHEHSPQSASGVRPQNAEPLAVTGRLTNGVRCRPVKIPVFGRAMNRGDVAERRGDLRFADPCQALMDRLARRNRGQAFRHAAMGFQVNLGQQFQQRPLGGAQIAPSFQVVGQAPGLVERPGLKGGHELALVDDPVLKGEQSEKEVSVSDGGHGTAPGQDVVPGEPNHGNGARSRGERRDERIIAWT